MSDIKDSTLLSGKGICWLIYDIFSLISFIFSSFNSIPSINIVPEVGCTNPKIILSRVDFPPPFGPMIAKKSLS